VAAAQPANGVIDVYPQAITPRRITVRTERVNRLLATSLTDNDVAAYLTPLGIEFRDGVTTAPTWRPDLEREIDIVEEVARRIGLNQIVRSIPASPAKVGALTSAQRDRRTITDVLIGAGYDETYSLPLLAPADLERAGLTTDGMIEVENPLRAEESILRPALRSGLLRAVSFNAARGEPNVALFETGTVFAAPAPGNTLPTEQHRVAFARSHEVVRSPHEPNRAVDVYDATAVLRALAQELRLANFRLEAASIAGYRPGRSAHVVVDDQVVGEVGEIATGVVSALDSSGPVVFGELDLDALMNATRQPRAGGAVSRFPASMIDLAFIVDETTSAAAIEHTLRAVGGELLESVRLFDVFRSDALAPGKVSLAFSVRFRALDRTLTDREVSDLRRALIDAVSAEHGAELRA
jgi:phenylalanyl-tRNA synthetase beta chain